MSVPIQRPASNSEARKAAASKALAGSPDGMVQALLVDPGAVVTEAQVRAVADFHSRAVLAALDTPSPAGLPGYFVHPDGFGAPVIWQGTGPDDPTCRPVLEGWGIQAVAPDLWVAIAALVEGKP